MNFANFDCLIEAIIGKSYEYTSSFIDWRSCFGRPATSRILGSALIGAMLPDLSLYLMVDVSLILLKISPETVFGELYFSDSWQIVLAIDNSFLIWLGLLASAIWRSSQ